MSKRTNVWRRLPVELIDNIMQYLDPILHVKITGLTAKVKHRLLHTNNMKKYFELMPSDYNPLMDNFFFNHFNVANLSIAPYITFLCSFETQEESCNFFNNCLPENVRVEALNWPSLSLKKLMSDNFVWYKLARKLIKHEHEMDRFVMPSTISFNINDSLPDSNMCKLKLLLDCCIEDCNLYDINNCPFFEVFVNFDDTVITLCTYFSFIAYRIVDYNE
ncbi:lef-7 [Palpita vitrealis nucleopolyhedrovirus]|uniref:Lef-7 n=1 Tax=Palpita vitrealis nucleopolyhedrovirus TaxID=2951960 RepID=A0AAE9LNJ1_9ABAC|nr:lef-7 [Palpita vitrealis nucleopolyhedrovirus]